MIQKYIGFCTTLLSVLIFCKLTLRVIKILTELHSWNVAFPTSITISSTCRSLTAGIGSVNIYTVCTVIAARGSILSNFILRTLQRTNVLNITVKVPLSHSGILHGNVIIMLHEWCEMEQEYYDFEAFREISTKFISIKTYKIPSILKLYYELSRSWALAVSSTALWSDFVLQSRLLAFLIYGRKANSSFSVSVGADPIVIS